MTQTGILKFSTVYLTGTTAIGDQYPGVSTNGYSGQPNQYQGQLGAKETINFGAAKRLSDPAGSAPLQGCTLQYVQYAADGTNYAQGQLLYWKDETAYIVTNVPPTTTSANFAGFAPSAITQGYYGVVITAGIAYALYRASVTSTTAETGVYAVVNTDTVDALTDATADATAGVNKLFIGIAKDAPANSGLKRVYITNIVEVS